MTVVVFEDEHWRNFLPLSACRHVSLQLFGSRTLLDHIRTVLGDEDLHLALAGREHIAHVTREKTTLEYNAGAKGEVLLINGRLRPGKLPRAVVKRKGRFLLRGSNGIAMARVGKEEYEALISENGEIDSHAFTRGTKGIEVLKSGEESLFSHLWQLMNENPSAILPPTGARQSYNPSGTTRVVGPPGRLFISSRAKVEEYTVLDTRRGTIVVEDDAIIEPFSLIAGPCFIGKKSKIHSGLIRTGTTIGEDCRIGGEVENCIIYSYTNKAHHGFLGHSAVGEWVNIGAGAVTSDLKNTYGTIRVTADGKRVDSGLLKLGGTFGDLVKVSIGSLVFAGKKVGIGSQVLGPVGIDVPSFTFYDGRSAKGIELQLEMVIRTQERMMARRGGTLTKASKRLLEFLYRSTEKERKDAGVMRGRLEV